MPNQGVCCQIMGVAWFRPESLAWVDRKIQSIFHKPITSRKCLFIEPISCFPLVWLGILNIEHKVFRENTNTKYKRRTF